MHHQKKLVLSLSLMGIVLTVGTGCQTYMGGMTLPSPHYLEHFPSYIPKDSDESPLPKERATQEEYAGMMRPGIPVGGGIAPAPVPPGGDLPPAVPPVPIPPR